MQLARTVCSSIDTQDMRVIRKNPKLLLCAQAHAGVPAASPTRRCVEAAALTAQLPCRLGLHAYLAAGVLAHPAAFAARSYYWVAVAGCAYVNAVNLRQAALAMRRWHAGRTGAGAAGGAAGGAGGSRKARTA